MEPEHVASSVGLDELQREFDAAVMSIMDSLAWKRLHAGGHPSDRAPKRRAVARELEAALDAEPDFMWRATGKRVLQRIVQRRWVRVAFVYKIAAYTLTLPEISAVRV